MRTLVPVPQFLIIMVDFFEDGLVAGMSPGRPRWIRFEKFHKQFLPARRASSLVHKFPQAIVARTGVGQGGISKTLLCIFV